MSFIFDRIPYFKGYVRREFTRNLKDGQGEFLPCVFVGVRCQRGLSLYFQAWLQDGSGGAGAMFLAPIQACVGVVSKPAGEPVAPLLKDIPPALIQPWDVFSETFSVSRIDLFHRSRVYALPDRAPGRYLMTIDFAGNELSEDLEQHKSAHIVVFDDGHIGAFPNNRLLVEDLAFLTDGVTKERPDFVSLEPEFYSE